jgi:hypothetical protein
MSRARADIGNAVAGNRRPKALATPQHAEPTPSCAMARAASVTISSSGHIRNALALRG